MSRWITNTDKEKRTNPDGQTDKSLYKWNYLNIKNHFMKEAHLEFIYINARMSDTMKPNFVEQD